MVMVMVCEQNKEVTNSFFFNKAKHINTEGEAIVVTAEYNTHNDVSNPCIETARPPGAA